MHSQDVAIPIDGEELSGRLQVPEGARNLTIFAHGSGSSRHSPRNQFVAAQLEQIGLGTLLFDLLTPEEERLDAGTGRFRFDVPLLAARLVAVSRWARGMQPTARLPLAFFGASTGAAAALIAAAHLDDWTSAVVSRGGRPDLAGDFLGKVRAPTLLIVGGDDTEVIRLNEEARSQMGQAYVQLEVVPGAGHLFEGPGELAQVSTLAGRWLSLHL
jgi:dienelactone hydrolase